MRRLHLPALLAACLWLAVGCAPFDAIIVTCAPDQVPQPLIEQLRDGGRMVIPVGPNGGVQELYLLEKRGGEVKQRGVLPVRFVPMTRDGGAKQ